MRTTDIYFGDKPVIAQYLGAQLVWQRQSKSAQLLESGTASAYFNIYANPPEFLIGARNVPENTQYIIVNGRQLAQFTSLKVQSYGTSFYYPDRDTLEAYQGNWPRFMPSVEWQAWG